MCKLNPYISCLLFSMSHLSMTTLTPFKFLKIKIPPVAYFVFYKEISQVLDSNPNKLEVSMPLVYKPTYMTILILQKRSKKTCFPSNPMCVDTFRNKNVTQRTAHTGINYNIHKKNIFIWLSFPTHSFLRRKCIYVQHLSLLFHTQMHNTLTTALLLWHFITNQHCLNFLCNNSTQQ
jgi:hypothetical protein